MQRWDFANMEFTARTLFAKIHKRKHTSNPNHDIHFLTRELDIWLPTGIRALIDGSYISHPLRRYYFEDEVVDQLEIPDRIYQHVLLKQLKPTFQYVAHKNCYHLFGPTGVKRATQHILEALQTNEYHYVIRVDIKSFYRSIPQYKLIQDIKATYDDENVQRMLEDIIRNPIDTPRGFQNPECGIALRGPLSQLFSAIYLKPLDAAFDAMEVVYARYQDDILILCKTKQQYNRCRRKMSEVLQERRLTLSRKKSRFGRVEDGFHFLGINYLGTQTPNNTNATEGLKNQSKSDHLITSGGG